MTFLACRLADIVQEGGSEQAGAARSGVDGRLPSRGQQAVIELESKAGDALGMREIGIEAIRPKLHAAGGKHLDLLALGQRGAPDLPERIGADHLRAIAVDALGALRENYFTPMFARIFIGKYLTGNGCRPEHVEIVNFAE
jgi:hypothetical protein